MKKIFLIFISFSLFIACKNNTEDTAATDTETVTEEVVEEVTAPVKTGPITYYVMVKSGLNLRATRSPRSEKLVKLDYGTSIVANYDGETMEEEEEEPFHVEGYEGNMIKVKYGNLEGYVFDGFLSELPTPDGWVFSNYEKVLRRQGFKVKHTMINEDDPEGTFVKNGESLTFPASDMQEAFIIARRLGLADYRKELSFDMSYPTARYFGKLINGMKGGVDKLRPAETTKDDAGNDVENYTLENTDTKVTALVKVTRDKDDHPILILDTKAVGAGETTYRLEPAEEGGYTLTRLVVGD